MKQAVMIIVVTMVIALPFEVSGIPSESHENAAKELLQIMDVERTIMGGAKAMANAMVQQNPMLSPYRDVLLNWAESILTWEEIGPAYVEMYTEAFSESELREITEFYKTPTGQKFLAVMPEMMNRGAMIGADLAKEHELELEEMIRKRAKELETVPPAP